MFSDIEKKCTQYAALHDRHKQSATSGSSVEIVADAAQVDCGDFVSSACIAYCGLLALITRCIGCGDAAALSAFN